MDKSQFLIDTNSFITPYRGYYSFRIAGSFWKGLGDHIQNGNIAILDVVKDELIVVDDELSEWVEGINISNIISRKTTPIIEKYGEILNYIQNNQCYKPDALTEWSTIHIADPWIIAAAAVEKLTIVTFETPNTNLNTKNPSKIAKIPDVADAFGVEWCNLFDMMDQLNIVL